MGGFALRPTASSAAVKELGNLIRIGDAASFWEDPVPGLSLPEKKLISATVVGVYPHSFLVEYENRAGGRERRAFLIADILTRRVVVENKALKQRVAALLKVSPEILLQRSNASLAQRCRRKKMSPVEEGGAPCLRE